MAVTGIEIQRRGPYEGGVSFGESGAYERIDGVLRFAVDPELPANEAIVDLDRAARDSAGRVHFLADFCILQPLEAARGNRRLLYQVSNRGRKGVQAFNNGAAELVPGEGIAPGDGLLMRRGWTVAWCGWQWDVLRSNVLMGLEAPQALEHGQPIAGQVMVQFQLNQRVPDHLLADRIHRPYPAADVDDADAELAVRDWFDAPRTIIPCQRWRFARDEHGRPVADPGHVWLDGGFDPGRSYEVVYRTNICPVVGTGLLAMRDAVSFWRYGDAASGNPCAGRIDHTIGHGISQSGRYLRHFLYLGLNLDEAGRQVFDGLLPHVAGARRGEFNHRYGQPSQQYVPSFGHLPPFASEEQTDPLTGQADGLLRRQRALGGVPRVIFTNSGAEYWRGDGSLLHTDLLGQHDVEPPEDVRIYYFAGTQHGSGSLPLTNIGAAEGSKGVNALNTVDYRPLLRAALDNLDRWITAGEEPPPSVFPRLADGTAITRAEAIEAVARIPGAGRAIAERLKSVRRLDLGRQAAQGIGRYPPIFGERYPTLVSSVDADGNEVGGLRLPDLSVPLATYAGWNPRHPDTGGEGQIVDMLGSTLPLAATAAERRASGDPRPAIGERYRDRDDYLARVRAAAEALAAQRAVLPEDIDRIVQTAAQRYEAFAAEAVEAAGGGQ